MWDNPLLSLRELTVKDDEFREDHEFENIEKDQIDEFERELADESKKKRKKLYLIAGGTVVCAASLLFFTGWLDQMEPAKPSAPAKVSPPRDTGAKASEEKPTLAKAPEEKPQAAKSDPEMEAAQAKNIVEEDSKAPGAATQASKPSPDKDAKAGEMEQKKTDKPRPSTEPAVGLASAKPHAGFVVQAVATSDAALAISAREDLAVKGHKSWISIGKARENVFVVEVGEFASTKEATPQKEKLEKAGFEPRVAQSGAKTALIAGVFQEKAEADAVADRVKAAGFAPKVVSRKDSSDLYLVRVGPYGSADEAKKASDVIKAAGYSTISVNQ
jgi:cell division protein FtsN